LGAVCGIVFAVYYRDQGIRQKKYSWEFEDDDEDDPENAYWKITTLEDEDEK
jgi:hypothetical protein